MNKKEILFVATMAIAMAALVSWRISGEDERQEERKVEARVNAAFYLNGMSNHISEEDILLLAPSTRRKVVEK
jgi:hemerythrin-like domain-containing protein